MSEWAVWFEDGSGYWDEEERWEAPLFQNYPIVNMTRSPEEGSTNWHASLYESIEK